MSITYFTKITINMNPNNITSADKVDKYKNCTGFKLHYELQMWLIL